MSAHSRSAMVPALGGGGLTSEQSRRLEADGVVGPFPRFADDQSLDEITRFAKHVTARQPSHPLYGHYPRGRFSVRDWHLVHEPLCDLLTDPAVARRLESVAGEQLVLWRSKIFHKPPGSAELAWHQEWGAFNGEEIGNDRPALIPRDPSRNWNWTVWISLQDMSPERGPIRFMRGSHRRRYPWHHVPMAESAFFTSFVNSCTDVGELVSRARSNNLFLDLDTAALFCEADLTLPLTDARARVASFLETRNAKLTPPFSVADEDILVFDSMKRGEFLIFTERTMHGSLANSSPEPRLAVNARMTFADTLVYPQRFSMAPVDGSNLDIRHHRCVPLGRVPHSANVYTLPRGRDAHGASPNARLEATST